MLDPSGAAIAGAQVTLENAVAGFARITITSAEGGFSFSNVPFHSYQVRSTKEGFAAVDKAVSLRSNVPVEISLRMELSTSQTAITVSADSVNLVDPEETGSHSQMNQRDIERLATGPGSRGLESVLVSFPGFAKNANGAIHPRGAHNQMTFVIDGMPISDQLTGAFANAVDPSVAQTVELYTGNISAEYGGKVGAVANITTRSGSGTGRHFGGSLLVDASQFDSLNQTLQAAGEGKRIGYSVSLSTMKSNRYLDQVSLDNLHNGEFRARIPAAGLAAWIPGHPPPQRDERTIFVSTREPAFAARGRTKPTATPARRLCLHRLGTDSRCQVYG
ncbi:MAG: TonB-dependent receptor [Bryobacterales bacterium]|nr:TonB-dependent receptor [Bryobacterales bacterium]